MKKLNRRRFFGSSLVAGAGVFPLANLAAKEEAEDVRGDSKLKITKVEIVVKSLGVLELAKEEIQRMRSRKAMQ